ncbi:MAG: hypothetical protein Q9195_006480 [Heterodermia aff. obscurata]
MPTGKKDLEWLKRADGAVSEPNHQRTKTVHEMLTMPPDSAKLFQESGQSARMSQDVSTKISISTGKMWRTWSALHLTTIHTPRKATGSSSKLKAKSKTRSFPAIAEESPNTTTVDSEPSPAAPTLAPPKRAQSLDTLRLLCPTLTADLKGMIQWTDFVITMSDLGFEAEHRGGSEWTFRSSDTSILDGDKTETQNGKSIVIHQPQPDTKMGVVQLQRVEKRLERRFGWSQERSEGL